MPEAHSKMEAKKPINMKTIKSSLFSLLVLFVVTSFITSCSKDEQTNSNVSENAKVSNYLKSFYPTKFQLGKSIDTKISKATSEISKSIEVENVIITEVFVGDDTRARGYVITDKSTNQFLYFIDVNRIDYKLTSVKIDANETKVFENIEVLDKYISSNQLDFIKIAEDVNVSPSLVASKFWGSGSAHTSGDCVNGRDYWVQEYYVCWIVVSSHHVPAIGGGDLWSPCE